MICNLLISLIHQTNFLLDRQLKSLEAAFTEKGGLRERMYQARKEAHDQSKKVDFRKEINDLREVYRAITASALPETTKGGILHQLEKIANSLKQRETR